MKSRYRFEAVGGDDNIARLDIIFKCTQYQARRVFDAFAYCMATDGGWASLRCSLVDKEGRTQGHVYTCEFKGASNG